jgi:hypothetical protein
MGRHIKTIHFLVLAGLASAFEARADVSRAFQSCLDQARITTSRIRDGRGNWDYTIELICSGQAAQELYAESERFGRRSGRAIVFERRNRANGSQCQLGEDGAYRCWLTLDINQQTARVARGQEDEWLLRLIRHCRMDGELKLERGRRESTLEIICGDPSASALSEAIQVSRLATEVDRRSGSVFFNRYPNGSVCQGSRERCRCFLTLNVAERMSVEVGRGLRRR